MPDTIQVLDQTHVSELGVTIRNAGVAGAGGAGFPTYAKWNRIDEVEALMVNHQESEPNYYIDKWLGRERADDLAALFDALLGEALDLVVVGAKLSDRTRWVADLESATDATVYKPEDLPVDRERESGVVIAYTDDIYQLGMESVLLNTVGDTVIGRDLPMDHGWIVQNTETLVAIHDALLDGNTMTDKYVHVDGGGAEHRFLKVPVGTPASALLSAAGVPVNDLPEDAVLADGGPGWCFEITRDPTEFGVRKRTNCILILDEETVEEQTFGDDRIDVQDIRDWKGDGHERHPSDEIDPEMVRIPLITNPAFEGIVNRSQPIVGEGDAVSAGEMIAVPGEGGISIPQHASIDGEIADVSESHVTIRRQDPHIDSGRTAVIEATDRLYWTWCQACGEFVIPEETVMDPKSYVCEDCR